MTPDERNPRGITPEGIAQDTTRTVIVSAESEAVQARCEVCGHHLHKPSSVARGTGPICAGRVVDLEAVRDDG